MGRGTPGQGHPAAGRGPDRALAGRAGRPGLPRPRPAGRPGTDPDRCAGPRRAPPRRVLTRLAAGRSAWNAADIRGEVEQLIAAAGIVVDAAVRIELAEDLTARALARCVPLLSRERRPGAHPGLDLPAGGRRGGRAEHPARRPQRSTAGVDAAGVEPAAPTAERLDTGQAAAVAALAGGRPLVVIEGAAGAGKTTTLAATRRLLDEQGRGLVVVTPTLKAAKVAAGGGRCGRRVGGVAGLPARLALERRRCLDPAGRSARPTRSPAASTPGRRRGRGCARGICWWWTRPGCSTRTPPALCSPSPTSARYGSRCSATGTSWPRSGAAAFWTSPPARSTRRRT